VALTYGIGTCAGMMFAPAFGIDRGLWWIVHGQAHGVAQIFGWGGLFIMGVSFQDSGTVRWTSRGPREPFWCW